jgi:hypothetical protein
MLLELLDPAGRIHALVHDAASACKSIHAGDDRQDPVSLEWCLRPCSLATCVRVTLSALVAPSSGLMSLSNRLDQAAALVLQAATPPRAVSLPDASRTSN